jgi:AraC-like DNA-binding protein
VRLKAEGAERILGERLRDIVDAKISLEELFRSRDICSLVEKLTNAASSRERFIYTQQFLLAHLRAREADHVVCRAAALLRRRPFLRVQRLAADLSISERHLSRCFRSRFGLGLKCFARAARVEKIVAARRRGLSWADVAYTCGFADQAHMIHDVNAIVGEAPDRAFGCDDALAW